MNGRFSNSVIRSWMDDIVSKDLWLSLFAADPYTQSNPLTAEIANMATYRQQSVWTRTTDYSIELANDVTFRSIPPETTIVAIGAFDAPLNGELLFRDLLSEDGNAQPLYLAAGGSLRIPVGQMVAGVDIPT